MRGPDLSGFSPRRILVCQQRQIGDVLLCTPLFRLLRSRFPEAELHLFTEKKCADLLYGSPFIDAFHLIDKKKSFFAQLAFYRRTAALGFDLVIDLQQLPRCRTMVLFSRARVRLSFPSSPFIHWRYTHLAAPAPGYACLTKASLLTPLGITWNGEGPEIFLTEEERQEVSGLLAACGKKEGSCLISVDPTHRRASKRWPAERYAELIALASRENRQFLLLRGPGEENEIRDLKDLCLARGVRPESLLIPQDPPAIRLSAACIGQCRLHIGGCSAPRHMAAALGVPSLVIPGASGPEWRRPLPMHRELRPALPCQPCSRVECADPQCLLRVTPQEVLAAAEEMLGA